MDKEARQMLEETYRYARENNRMLHAMRRNAFWGGIVRFIVYAALLSAPIWFYMTYVNGVVEQLIAAMNRLQGAGAQTQTQLGEWQQAWRQFESKLPSFMQAPTSTPR